eukprot:CAMPEP_0184499050 /NCGR_PEP_ID=MMETSP0113_2-20130426/40518_1 /TAXON_ID=91329 /ORGANISM="Norrisiella sphaerica, Strain BC52" /LENGTH=784 /DNA_ID=CAMNT_0026886817 /DNA_START=200 /DNA_END=2554 /DNA_ORIENTATION=-
MSSKHEEPEYYPPLHRREDEDENAEDEKKSLLETSGGSSKSRGFAGKGRARPKRQRHGSIGSASDLPVDPNRHYEGFLSLFPNWASIAKPFFCEPGIRAKAWCLSISTVILVLVQVSVIVGFSYANRNFNTALQKKDRDGFYTSVAAFLGLILLACPIFTLGTYIEGYVAIVWREFLAKRFLNAYYKRKSYYHLKKHVEIDNPDQRITDDINDFVETSVKIITLLVKAIAYISAFTGVLFSISSALVIFLLFYSTVGVVIAVYCFGRKLMELQRTALEREATFRFSLVRVRENAESVAFYDGGTREHKGSTGLFGSLLTTLLSQIKWLAGLQFFNTNFQYITFVLPPLIIAPLYFEGKVDFGVIPQASMAFGTIRSNLALLANNLATFASLGATAARLTNLRDALKEAPVPEGELIVRKQLKLDEANSESKKGEKKGVSTSFDKDKNGMELEMHDVAITDSKAKHHRQEDQVLANPEGYSLRVENLTLKTPDGRRLLVANLSLSLKPGNSLLIVGPSGCGKSSLLRCFAGLWGRGAGMVAMLGSAPNLGLAPCEDDEVSSESKENISESKSEGSLEQTTAFVPQKPYMALFGTLKEQLVFPTPIKKQRKAAPLGQDPLGPSRHASTESQIKVSSSGGLYKAIDIEGDGVNIPHHKYKKALEAAALGELMDRHNLDDKIAWEDVLSLGQQQRLTLARLFLRDKISLAFLDEATSACDSTTEQTVYSAIQKHIPTYISIAHRVRSLLKFHTHVLQCQTIGETNRWTFMTASEFKSRQSGDISLTCT